MDEFIYLNRDKITFPCGATSFVIDCNMDDSVFYLTYDTGWVVTKLVGVCDHPGKVCITRKDFDQIISAQKKKIARRDKIKKLLTFK